MVRDYNEITTSGSGISFSNQNEHLRVTLAKKEIKQLPEEELRTMLLDRLKQKRQTRVADFTSSGSIHGTTSITPTDKTQTGDRFIDQDHLPAAETSINYTQQEAPEKDSKRTKFDRVLFIIEGAAVVALLFIVLMVSHSFRI